MQVIGGDGVPDTETGDVWLRLLGNLFTCKEVGEEIY